MVQQQGQSSYTLQSIIRAKMPKFRNSDRLKQAYQYSASSLSMVNQTSISTNRRPANRQSILDGQSREDLLHQNSIQYELMSTMYLEINQMKKKIKKLWSDRKKHLFRQKIMRLRLQQISHRQSANQIGKEISDQSSETEYNLQTMQFINNSQKLSNRYDSREADQVRIKVQGSDYITINGIKREQQQGDQHQLVQTLKLNNNGHSNAEHQVCPQLLFQSSSILIPSPYFQLQDASQNSSEIERLPIEEKEIYQKQIPPPHGTELIGNVFLIWKNKGEKTIINFLKKSKLAIHILLFLKPRLCNYLKDLISKQRPWVVGVHIYKKLSFNPTFLYQQSSIKYLSFGINYSHLHIMDRQRSFPHIKSANYAQLQSLNKNNKYYKTHVDNRGNKRNTIVVDLDDDTWHNKYIEQIDFVQIKGKSLLVGLEVQFQLKGLQSLQILAFKNLSIDNAVTLKDVYGKCKRLHTLVFDNCTCNHNQLVSNISVMKVGQLKHLAVIASKLPQKIPLELKVLKIILAQISLQTLILQYVQFKDSIQSKANFLLVPSKNFPNIQDFKLRKLKHLNLEGSQLMLNNFFCNLHDDVRKQLKFLNLSSTQINWQHVDDVKRFQSLEQLSVSYTELGSPQIIQLTKKMKNLSYLSLQGLNGLQIVYEENISEGQQKKYYGKVTTLCLDKMAYKKLKYVNIYGCNQLSTYKWEDFNDLMWIRVNKGLISRNDLVNLRSRSIKMIIQRSIYDQVQPKSQEAKAQQLKINCQSDQDQRDFQ